MAIKHSEGKAFQATLLSRTETTVFVAVDGEDDVIEFSNINAIWAADREPVSIISTWQRREDKPVTTEPERCCSHKLAARLIHLSLTRRRERPN
jgi:hypothetical protein